MRDVAGTSVRHAIVAENGVSEIVWTSVICGGGPTGAAGVVVVSVWVVLAGGGSVTPGRARNRSSAEYSESKAASGASAAGAELSLAATAPSAEESDLRPGISGPPVSSPTACTGRPFGGAKLKGAEAAAAAGAGAAEGAESDPGRASLKPIVEPATTASESQQTVRRGTL